MSHLVLKPGREKSVRRRHPWIFSGAVSQTKGSPAPGSVVRVLDANGDFLAWGYYNGQSKIQVRLLEWSEDVRIDGTWWRRRLEDSILRRAALANRSDLDSYRLVNAEADLLPGLVVDRYGDFLVLQPLTAGIQRIKHELAECLDALLRPTGVYEKGDSWSLSLEGVDAESGVLRGEEPPDRVCICECGHRFWVDLKRGQKTGFFLDQRFNRDAVARYAQGKRVLDCFAYTGAFSVYAAAAGAVSVTRVEGSSEAFALSEENLRLNGLVSADRESCEGNAFEVLRGFRDRAHTFDMVVLDPPKFAHARSTIESAARGYKDINLLAIKLLLPEGILATFSCSGNVSADRFQRIVSEAATDAGRQVQVLDQLAHGPDHPTLLSFPESMYLKGLICRVL
ncbi:MAG: class I SAM-dependent rRNA methyltransferase [Deltaproteobacteria bacterium]|nr:class I SAM-dependent rRNA methyltransferase [Deltaproteobacteria bacterium]